MSIYDVYTIEQIRTILKNWFETGKKPTQPQLHFLIDTILDKNTFNNDIDLQCNNILNFTSLSSTCGESILIYPNLDLQCNNILNVSAISSNSVSCVPYILIHPNIWTNNITANQIVANNVISVSSTTQYENIVITELSGFKITGQNYQLSIPDSIVADLQYNGVILSGVQLSSTGWASFEGDVQGRNVYSRNCVYTDCISSYSSDINITGRSFFGENEDGSDITITAGNSLSSYGGNLTLNVGHGLSGNGFITLSGDTYIYGNLVVNQSISADCGNSDEWCSVYTQVNELSDFWDGDFCNETVNLRTVSGCWDNDLSASFINISAYEVNFSNNVTILSTLDVGTGNIILFVGNKVGVKTNNPNEALTVNGNISSNNIVYSKCGDSNEWCSVYTQVNELSDFWDGDFCNETVNLRTVSGCWDNDLSASFINVSAYDVNFSNNVTILSTLDVGTGSIILFVGNKVGINTTNPNEMLTVNGNISSNSIIYAECGNSNDWCDAANGNFCDTTINVLNISACQSIIELSGDLQITGLGGTENSIVITDSSGLLKDTTATINSGYEGGAILNIAGFLTNPPTASLVDGDMWINDNPLSSVSLNYFDGINVHNIFFDNTYGENFNVSHTSGISTINLSLTATEYNTAFYDVAVVSGSNVRASQLMVAWYSNNVVFTETQTTDIGNTSVVDISAGFLDGDIVLQSIIQTGTWTIKGRKKLI